MANKHLTETDVQRVEKLIARKMSNEEIAGVLGFSDTTVSRIRTGTHAVQLRRVNKSEVNNPVNTSENKTKAGDTQTNKVHETCESVTKSMITKEDCDVKSTGVIAENVVSKDISGIIKVVHTVDNSLMTTMTELLQVLNKTCCDIHDLQTIMLLQASTGTKCKKNSKSVENTATDNVTLFDFGGTTHV